MFQPRRFRRTMFAAVTGAATVATTFSAVPAHAVEPIISDPLPVSAVTAFLADSAHGHLLIASGSASNGVIVTTLAGATVTTLAGAGGIDDVSITPDGQFAFAASHSLGKIFKLDLTNLTTVGTWSTPTDEAPVSLAAVSSTSVAFGFDGTSNGVGVLTPTSSTTATYQVHTNPFYAKLLVRRIPGTTQVVAADTDSSMETVAVLETSTGTPVVLRDTSGFSYGLPNCEFIHDLAVSPDGATMLVACDRDNQQREFSLADFSAVATYPTASYSTAVAFSPDGQLVGAGAQTYDDVDVSVYHHTASDVSRLYWLDYNDYDDAGTPPRGMAFSADSTQLYVLAQDTEVTPNDLYLVTLPANSVPTFPPPVSPPPTSTPGSGSTSTTTTTTRPVASTITVVSPPRVFVGHPFAVSGTLAFAGQPAAGITVAFSKTVNGVTTSMGTTKTTATGAFAYPVTATAVGAVTYSAGFVGDLSHYGSSGSAQTTGARAPAVLTLKVAKVKGKVYAVTAHLSSWGVNRHVLITANKKVIGNGVVNSKGLLSVHFTRKKATTFVAVFTGDKNDYPARATKGLH